MIDRRGFLGALPIALLEAGRRGSRDPSVPGFVGRLEARSGASTRRSVLRPTIEAWGVQLYTVRQEMQADPDRTLVALAEIGYQEVELAGMYGMSARAMRGKLDAAGLRAVSSHHGLDVVRDGWDRTLDDALELGQSFVVVPSIPGDARDRDGLLRVADDFDRAGGAAAVEGLRFGYHNHDWEFTSLADGSTPMQLLLDRTDARLVEWQMDVYWSVQGGAGPLEWADRHAGRISTVHVKDRTASGEMVDVGDGVIDYATILAHFGDHGLLHAFIEHDAPDDAIASVRRSFRHVSSLGVAP